MSTPIDEQVVFESQKVIPVSQLLLDLENPRFPEEQRTERDALRLMSQEQAEKILELAEHIIQHGLSINIRPIVMPTPGQDGFYTVLDGNRRVTVLKLLEAPEIAKGALPERLFQRLRSDLSIVPA
jgi:hypothetical protein